MPGWWKKTLMMRGQVMFRGDLPIKPEEFSFPPDLGIAVGPSPGNWQSSFLRDMEVFGKPDPEAFRASWSLELTHPEWGQAQVVYVQDIPIPTRELFEYSFIPDADRDAAMSAKTAVMMLMKGKHEHVLRDRKMLLRFMRAVMGDDGVVAVDLLSRRVWTSDELDIELSHDADLDVEGILSIDFVSEDDGKAWVHTHGLSEIGAFDFSILSPCKQVLSNAWELARMLAFSALEGEARPSMDRFELLQGGRAVKLVPMAEFLKATDTAHREWLAPQLDDMHRQTQSVLCEPGASLVGRLLGRTSLQPSRLLSGSLPESPMFLFSNSATELMAERARKTYPVLRSYAQEFDEFEFPAVVKLGYTVDGARTETEREHMWFEVHEFGDDWVDATLANQPQCISRMKEGDRGRHDINLITDWMIMTPLGYISPRSTTAARMVGENTDKLREAMREMDSA